MINKKLNFILIAFMILLQSCVSKKQVLYLQDLNVLDIGRVNSHQTIIQENDILNIDITSIETKASVPYNKLGVSGMVNNSLELMQLNGYLVSNSNTINFPVLGKISVKGMTLLELQKYLKNRLESEGHLLKPIVNVRLLNAKVTILGEVNSPGTYTFTEKNISFLQALGLAGDLTIDGNRKDIVFIRESDGKRITTNLDLTSASFLTSPYNSIQPNDVIIVNPSSKKIKSAGLIGNISTALSIASILLSTIILIR